MKNINNRTLFALSFFIGSLAMGLVLIAQYGFNIRPCALCVLQRFSYSFLATTALIAFFHQPRSWGNRLYGLLSLLFVLSGVAAAARQVWLQHLPKGDITACIPGFGYLVSHMPFGKAIEIIFNGSMDCSIVHTQVLGLSIAGWSLVGLGALSLVSLKLIFCPSQCHLT